MSVIGEQIKKYRGIRGMTQQEIADALGESSGRVIYNWEKGIGRPDCDKLAKLCDLLGVSADEMIGCRSMSERPTASEWETIKKYRVLDEHGKEIVDYLIDSEYRRVSATDRKAKCRMLRMDYYTLPASAGTGNILDSELAEEILVPESKEAEKADFSSASSEDKFNWILAYCQQRYNADTCELLRVSLKTRYLSPFPADSVASSSPKSR